MEINYCSVCFEEDDNKTYCNHEVCKECIDKIININNKCPLCRATLSYKEQFEEVLHEIRENYTSSYNKIRFIMEQTGCNIELATIALENNMMRVMSAMFDVRAYMNNGNTHFPIYLNDLNENDIGLVISQTNCTRLEAINALQDNDNDLVNAIMEIEVMHDLNSMIN